MGSVTRYFKENPLYINMLEADPLHADEFGEIAGVPVHIEVDESACDVAEDDWFSVDYDTNGRAVLDRSYRRETLSHDGWFYG